jgi:CheY-like chemotaxis protein
MDRLADSPRGSRVRRVLVVVPNARMVAFARKLIAEVGIEIICCDSTAQAMDILKLQSIDLIAAEAFMENDDLFKFIKRVRALPRYLHTPIWVVAAEPGPRGVQIASHVGKVALLLGADYFTVAYYADVPRMIAKVQALFRVQGLAS